MYIISYIVCFKRQKDVFMVSKLHHNYDRCCVSLCVFLIICIAGGSSAHFVVGSETRNKIMTRLAFILCAFCSIESELWHARPRVTCSCVLNSQAYTELGVTWVLKIRFGLES